MSIIIQKNDRIEFFTSATRRRQRHRPARATISRPASPRRDCTELSFRRRQEKKPGRVLGDIKQ